MWFIDYLAGVLPFYFAMKDSGIDYLDAKATMAWAEARFPPPEPRD